MCLYLQKDLTRKLKRRTKPFKVYKELKWDPNIKKLFSPVYFKNYKSGINRGNRKSIELTKNEISLIEVNRGLHFHLSMPSGFYKNDIVEFTVDPKDIVAAGYDEVVVMRAHLSKEERDRFIKYREGITNNGTE